MRFLLDTNVLIPAEPTSVADVESKTSAIVDLLRLVSQGQHTPLIHPASLQEVLRDRDVPRRDTRALLLGKYLQVAASAPHEHEADLRARRSTRGESQRDRPTLLSAVEANAVDYFVTEDEGIHRRARRVALDDRVLSVADAIVAIQALFPTIPQPPPLVASVLAHQLNEADPIFLSFSNRLRGIRRLAREM